MAVDVTPLRGAGAGQHTKMVNQILIASNMVGVCEALLYGYKAGLDLEVKEFQDYIVPNTATEDGSVDANYFQNQPYLDDFNKKRGTHIVPVVTVHLEPLGLYSHKVKKADALKSGATVAVPNDAVNEARALKLLAAGGLILAFVSLDAARKRIQAKKIVLYTCLSFVVFLLFLNLPNEWYWLVPVGSLYAIIDDNDNLY